MLWTETEIRELITLWPTTSASQIARQLQRPRAAIAGKVKRLRDEGVLPRDAINHLRGEAGAGGAEKVAADNTQAGARPRWHGALRDPRT